MLSLARERAIEYGRSSEEDTLDLIKLLLEWRGRVSIVSEADEYYVTEQLNLDPENAKALLDLYEIIGPGAGYSMPTFDDDDDDSEEDISTEAGLAKSGGKARAWIPKLKEGQDEVDEIVLSILGPNFKAPSSRSPPSTGQVTFESSESKFDQDDSFGESKDDSPAAASPHFNNGLFSGESVTSSVDTSTQGGGSLSSAVVKTQKNKKNRPSPLESTWVIETKRGKVTRLAVTHEGVTGNFPQALRRLTYLKCLELPCLRPWFDPEAAHELIPTQLRPKLAADISATATFGYLQSLVKLDLHGNLLTGPIPGGLGNLKLLEELDMSRNRFTGHIPKELGKLTCLTSFDASNCRLNGIIEEEFLRGCTSLQVLFLSDNMLHGKFPGEAMACLSNLRELDLSHNGFIGSLAVEFPNRIRKCERLLLNDNQMGGRLPSTLMDLTSCRELNLSNNSFKGRLPLGIGSLHRTLTHVDVSQNEWNEEEKAELLEFLTNRLHSAVPNIIV